MVHFLSYSLFSYYDNADADNEYRALKIHTKWHEKRNGKIILPFTIHPNYPAEHKTTVLEAIDRMNTDLGCAQNYYIPYEDYDKDVG